MQKISNDLIKPRFLYRPHIKKRLEGILTHPMFFVISGMGYGKTTAVREFLNKKRKMKYIWFAFDKESKEDIWLWSNFCRIIEQTNYQMGKKLFENGPPQDKADFDRLVKNIASEIEMETIMVFDDVHECRSDYLIQLIKDIALAGIENLHVVLISRTYPAMNVEELVSTQKAGILTQKNLTFSYTECEDFFILNNAKLSEREADMLYDKVNGWVAALYLALMHYLLRGNFDGMEVNTGLMNSAIFSRLDEETQTSLLMLSKLDYFKLDQAEFITKDRTIRDTIKRLHENNCFTKYDAATNIYSFHAMFRMLLDEEFTKRGMDANELYESQGDWCLISGDRLGAISAYTECRDFERILSIMAERQSSFLMNVAPRVLTKAFSNMPLDVRLSNPIGYLTYIYSYSNIIDIKKGADMLAEAKAYYQSVRNLDDRNQIFGEIALIESLTAFNDLHKMFECYDRANDYFDGGSSRIFNSSVSITFGIPLTMFLYHKEPGKLRELVELVEEELWIYTHIANGSGTGYDLLMRAEYEYMIGNFEKAEMIAYKAIYKAKTRDQSGIVMSASFLLIRMALFSGKSREVEEILLQMLQEVEKENNPAMRGCYEFVLGYVYGYMGKSNLIPQWLKDGNMNKGKLMAPARHSGSIIVGKIMCELHDYKGLETYSNEILELFTEKKNLIGIMQSKVFKAVALYHTTGIESAVAEMREVLELNEPDGCYVILAENTYEIISILEEIGTPYALKVRDLAKAYNSNKAAYRNRKKEISLTKREKEVMDFVCDGYTAEAISKMIYVSHSTVKKHIKAAYEKLGVNKKADAIAEYKKIMGK